MKRCVLCLIGIVIFSSLLFGCDLVNTLSDNVIITMPNGKEYEVEDKIFQEQYLDVYKNKKKIYNKLGYLSTENKFSVDYKKDGQQGSFEFFIQPFLRELRIEFDQEITRTQILDVVDMVLDVTEFELEDLVFKDIFGIPIDAYIDGYGSNKKIYFEYFKDGPWKIANTNEPTPAGFAVATSLKWDAMEEVINDLNNSYKGIKHLEYKNHSLRPSKAEVRYLYKGFVIDDEANWYRISDSDIQFLINQDEIYDSLQR